MSDNIADLDHATIWLEPPCVGSSRSEEGRTWCCDAVYDACPDCGASPTRYVRADLFAAAEARALSAEGERDRLAADYAQVQELMLLADRFSFGADWQGNSVYVASRGPGAWTVSDGSFVLADNGKWEHEPMPSNRTDEFIARTRCTFAEAVRRAREALRGAP